MTRRFVKTLASALALATIAACSAGSTNEDPSSGTRLTVGFTAEPVSLDFTKNDGAAIPEALLGNVYEGLVTLDEHGMIVPALASSWTVSNDRKVYTFKLVDDAKFASGAPFTAEDAVYSINRVSTDWTTSVADYMDVVEKAEATAPNELRVTLERPSNDWLYRMTTRVGAMFSRNDKSDHATTTNGTGPYTVTNWKRGDSLQLGPNPHFAGTTPHFRNVTLRYFKDGNALNNALLSGGIDIISNLASPESLSQFKNRPEYKVTEGTTTSEVLLAFNNASGPFTDERIRQAARTAIDKPSLLKTCWAGKGTHIGSMVPPTDPWYEDTTHNHPYDQDKAKALLASAGTPNPTIRLRLPNTAYAISCGQVVKSDLEAVGFTVQLDQLEFPAAWLSQVMKSKDYDATIIAHVEPRDMGRVFSPNYYLGYNDPEFTRLIEEADQGTPAQEIENLKAAAQRISEHAAADFLFLMPHLVVHKADLTGIRANDTSESFDLTRIARK
ncbi:Nickel-binding periplasmic protein precursor [Dermatophilus congolensis]|uniref:Nickel-binding periplasmic protein n=1 Tax=Dermatophilus congolensis TaxID=1863 RepID=A0AA46BMN4_9MICO|nr:ABC transporter substrate-binding protein [Dermatophilus congolensis]STD07885.1 Nickel-binding periplasmic protein precursor [Dermatophilus congolensis]